MALLLIESGGSGGGFQVPLPGRDGVVVVDGDLHRGSIACDLFLATYYWLSDGVEPREGERETQYQSLLLSSTRQRASHVRLSAQKTETAIALTPSPDAPAKRSRSPATLNPRPLPSIKSERKPYRQRWRRRGAAAARRAREKPQSNWTPMADLRSSNASRKSCTMQTPESQSPLPPSSYAAIARNR